MAQLDKLFRTAVQYGASDLYLPAANKPILRINGDLIQIEEHPILDKKIMDSYILEIIPPNLKSQFEQTSDIDFSHELEGVARFRVNLFIQKNGLSAVFRLIPTQVSTIDDLKLPEQLKKISQFKNGLVLVTGPTGSGKSTTLAAIVNEINVNYNRHILTIEDPIEFVYKNSKSVIQQREVGANTMSFDKALRAALRESCDVILVGEMRDLETIKLALTAAETGHLVLATLHTSGAAKAVDRIIDVFPAEQQNQIRTQISETIRSVVWQSLLKTKDGKGRVAALEIMFYNTAISNLIRKGATHQINSIIETNAQMGMQTMRKALENLVLNGLVSQEEAIQYLPKGQESTES